MLIYNTIMCSLVAAEKRNIFCSDHQLLLIFFQLCLMVVFPKIGFSSVLNHEVQLVEIVGFC